MCVIALQGIVLKILNNNISGLDLKENLMCLSLYLLKTLYSRQYLSYQYNNIFDLIRKYSYMQLVNTMSLKGYVFNSTEKEHKVKSIYNEVNQVVIHTFFPILTISVEILSVTGLFLYAVYSDIKCLIFIPIILIFIIIIKIFEKSDLSHLGRLRVNYETKRLKVLNDTINSYETIKLCLKDCFIFNKYNVLTKNVVDSLTKLKLSQSVIRIYIELVVVLFILTLVLASIYIEDFDGNRLIALMTPLSIRLIPSFSKIKMAIQSLRFHSATLEEFIKNTEPGKDLKTISVPQKYYHNIKRIYGLLEKNNLILITGKSGSGKSTILNSLYGNLNIDDKKIQSLHSKDIFYSTQFISILSHDFWENIVLRPNFDLSSKACNRVRSFLKYIDAYYLIKSDCHQTSGGEKKIISLCRMILFDCKYNFIDEPTSGLDIKRSSLFWDYLETQFCCNSKNDKKVIIVSHENSLSNSCVHVSLS